MDPTLTASSTTHSSTKKPLQVLRSSKATQRRISKTKTATTSKYKQPFSVKHPSLNELAWQARWAAGELGRYLTTEDGLSIEILHPGIWNREPGPDFRFARISINNQAPQQGDIEFDIQASDWESHGHAINPNFENVLLHVFLKEGRSRHFSRTLSHRSIPQVCLNHQNPHFTSQRVKVDFLPNLPATQDDRIQLLRDAARQRLQRKAEAIQRRISIYGIDDTLYQSIARTLGYKNNALPFSILAQRVSLQNARSNIGESLLFGIAGFLDGGRFAIYSKATREYARTLWDGWWKARARSLRLILPPSTWRGGALRPANHPHRRIAALHALIQKWPAIRNAFNQPNPQPLLTLFKVLHHPYWSYHAKLDGTLLRQKTALIGNSRAADILANVYYPWQYALHRIDWTDYLSQHAPQVSTVVRRSADALFEPSYAGKVVCKLALQQGLLELRIAQTLPHSLALQEYGPCDLLSHPCIHEY